MHRFVVVVFGLPGSGKSYFAEKFASVIGATKISSDEVRKILFEKNDYSINEKNKVYRDMIKRARSALENGENVVLDGTFYLKKWRALVDKGFKGIAKCMYIEVQASITLVKKRTSKKRLFSEADFSVYQQLKSAFEPMRKPHLLLNSTNENIDEMIGKASHYLKLK